MTEKLYLASYSTINKSIIYNREIKDKVLLNKIISIGIDKENKRLFYVSSVDRCLYFVPFP